MSDVRTTSADAGPRDEERILALLRTAGDGAPGLSAAEIGAIVETAQGHRLRNAAALALVDIGAREGAARIASALARAEVAPQGGTLLFALDQLGGSLPLDSLVNVIRHGSFEARAEALCFFVEDQRLEAADAAVLDRARRDLRAIAEGPDAEGAEAARAALDCLGGDAPATTAEAEVP